ncbi:MAG TPA: RimK/LysX family protein [Acidimicrobiales bacterium]|nr:RimK/LysX family protein [Acidimicrobiales bacterium]
MATTIGWREWVALPELGVSAVKAKIDTGARSSSLHAWDVTIVEGNGQGPHRPRVRFVLHPRQRDLTDTVEAEADLVAVRAVRSSNGEVENRPVIRTRVVIGGRRYAIELTLTRRDEMGFRMLLGRRALRRRFVIDPGRSFLCGGSTVAPSSQVGPDAATV